MSFQQLGLLVRDTAEALKGGHAVGQLSPALFDVAPAVAEFVGSDRLDHRDVQVGRHPVERGLDSGFSRIDSTSLQRPSMKAMPIGDSPGVGCG